MAESILIDVQVDVEKATKALDDANKQIEKLKQQQRDLKNELDAGTKTQEEYTAALNVNKQALK